MAPVYAGSHSMAAGNGSADRFFAEHEKSFSYVERSTTISETIIINKPAGSQPDYGRGSFYADFFYQLILGRWGEEEKRRRGDGES